MTDLRDLLLRGSGRDPALISERQEISFGELRELTEKIIEALRRFTGSQGKQVAFCFLPNSIELCLLYLSTVSGGQAVALFPPAVPGPRKQLLVATYRPKTVFLYNGELTSFMRECGYRAVRLSEVGTAIATWVSPETDGRIAEELGLLLSTSGSTGSPKLVRISADNIVANASGIVEVLELSSAQRAVTSVPLCYSYGLSILTSHLAAGSAVVVTDLSPLSGGFWKLVHRTATTTIGGTPLIHQVTLGKAHRLPPSVRVMTQAGARMPDGLLRDALAWAEDTGGAFYCMYGQTEATSRITCLAASRLADKMGSVGTPLPGGQVTVGPTRPGDAEGPIRYTGPNVMLGYAAGLDDLARGQTVETLDTGDIGRLDGDGFLYVTGRSSRFIKVLDRRISLDDIEEWFGSADRVAAVAASGGTPIVIFTTNESATLESARQEVAGTLGIPASMVVIRPLTAIPRTANGKFDYSLLERLVGRLA